MMSNRAKPFVAGSIFSPCTKVWESRRCVGRPEGFARVSAPAGLWVRTELFLTIFERHGGTILSDRVGESLISGGDMKLGMLVGEAGYDRLFSPALRVQHLIPAGRVDPNYVARLISGIVRSEMTPQRRAGRANSLLSRVVRLVGCLAGGWIVALTRGDAVNEYRFLVTAALARVAGALSVNDITPRTLSAPPTRIAPAGDR